MPQLLQLPEEETGTPIEVEQLSPPQIPVSDDNQKINALKYHFVLGSNSPGYDELMKSVQAGLDLQVKEQIATNEALKDAQMRNEILQQIAMESKDKTLDPAVHDFVAGLTRQELMDPELRYIKAYANAILNVPGPDYEFQEIFKDPETEEKFHQKNDVAASHIAFNEHIFQVKAKLQAQYDSKGILGKGWEIGERFVPFASYFNQRSTIKGPQVGSILLGANKEEQLERLFSLPLEKRVETFNAAIEEIAQDNLLDALEFAEAAYSYANDAGVIDDVFTAVDIATTIPFGLAGKAVRAIKGSTHAKTATKAEKVAEAVKPKKTVIPSQEAKKPRAPIPAAQADQAIKDQKKRAQLEEIASQGEAAFRASEEAKNGAGVLSPDAERLRALTEATKPDNPNIVADVMAASGKEKEAMAAKALKLNALKRSKVPPKTQAQIEEVESFVPSMADPKASAQTALTGKLPTSKVTAQGAVRIAEALEKVDAVLDEALEKSSNLVSRYTTDAMLKEAWQVAEKDFEKMYPSVRDAIIDSYHGRPEESKTNTAFIVTYLGKPDKTLFKKNSHAHAWAQSHYNLLPGYEVVPVNGKFAIRLQTYADETKLSDFKFDTADPTPRSVANTLFGYFRTTDDLINKLSTEQRKRITHAYSLLQNNVKVASKAISDLAKVPGRMERFEKVLRAGMHFQRPRRVEWRNKLTGQIEVKETVDVGLNFNREQFELKYYELNNRMPGEKEVLAYETYKKLLKFDFIVRNLDLTRDKVRLGLQEFQFNAWQATEEAGVMAKKPTALFDGKLLDELPYGHPTDSRVAIYSDEDGFAHIYDVNAMSANNREFVQKLIDEKGYRIIEIANPDAKPLRDYLQSEEAINFVVVKTPKTRPLGLQQIPERQGGHRIPAGQIFVKAPVVSKPTRKYRDAEGKVTEQELDRHFYEGDITLYGVHSEAKAAEIIPHLHKARDLFLQGDKQAFIEYVAKHVPRDPERFWKDFENKTIPTNVDYYVVKTGQGVNDVPEFKQGLHRRFPNLVDTIDSEFNKYRLINKKFAGQKNPDLFSWSTQGYDETNPVVKLETAKYIEPIEAMQSSMAALMRNRAYSDYVIRATESWIEEFGPLLKTDPRVLRANPIHHLHNPEWVDKPTDRDLFMAAQNSRRALLQLLGTRSELRNNVEWVKGKIVDQAYRAIGDSKSEKLADWLLPTSNDPLAYIRGAAFHMKLGLLNPIQMWTQSQTLFHMTAITGNPVRAGRSFVGATYMQMLQNTTNPKILDHVASLAAKSGFGTKEEFLESYELLRKTGLWFVEGEHGWRNDVLDPKIFQGVIGKVLDKGTVFFKGTERFVRLSAWNIAYREFREGLGPFATLGGKGAKVGPRELEKILKRQNDLAVNMTNDSAAAIQRGVFGLTTQFFGYQFRILDQILGKRLTGAERARILAMYSVVYGVPIGAGAGMLTPWYGDIKEYAERELGITADSGAWQLFFDGALSFLTEGITGDEYNPAKRYGPGGFEILKTVFDEGPSEDTLLTILGASASIFGDAVKWAMPAVTTLWSQVWDDEADQTELQPQEFIDAFRSISTVNNAVKAHLAYYAHAYYTRDGRKIADASQTDAIMTAFFGLTNSHIEKMYQQMEELREDDATRMELKKAYVKAKRDAMRAESAEDRRALMRKARIYLKSANLTTREASRWFSEALRGNEELILKMDREYRERFQKKLEDQ